MVLTYLCVAHLVAASGFLLPMRPGLSAHAVVTYFSIGFSTTIGPHRLLSHRSFERPKWPAYTRSARHGLGARQPDLSYLLIRLFGVLGLARNLKEFPDNSRRTMATGSEPRGVAGGPLQPEAAGS